MEQWLRQRLTDCLGFAVPDEMVQFVLTFSEPHLLDNYFESLLDVSRPDHRLFLNDLKQRMFKKSPAPADKNGTGPAKKNPLGDLVRKPSHKENKYSKQDAGKAARPAATSASDDPSASAATSTATGTKKKTKYVNLYDDAQSGVVLLKGRHHCDCQASRHRLVNNCLHCGRIVCEQEGSGPCLFCGQLVCRDDEQSLIESASKKGDALKRTLLQQQRPHGWEEAMALRNRLLEFDRTAERRTTVIDDESDYFRTNSVWLSDAEREKLRRLEAEVDARKHASRLSTRVTLDFSGRRMEVVEEPQLSAEWEDEVLREIAESTAIQAGIAHNMQRAAGEANAVAGDVHPLLEFPAPIFDDSVAAERIAARSAAGDVAPRYDGVYNRVQDKELLEIADQRCCMSMHQPYASLLVAGIKRHEGRTWYTAHRGRLWIAATARPADAEEVQRVEAFYRQLYGSDDLQFPAEYPAGCLLGSVLVQECLPQEEYRQRLPKGESDSPFVFVCSAPEELPIRFPVRGEHKIYKLDHTIHLAACKAMQRAAKLRAEEDTDMKAAK